MRSKRESVRVSCGQMRMVGVEVFPETSCRIDGREGEVRSLKSWVEGGE